MARNIPDEMEDALTELEHAKRALHNGALYGSQRDALHYLALIKERLEWVKEVTTPMPRIEDRDFNREFQD